jgi:flagellar biosynthesis/type III secretory pathway chaperone
VDTNACREQLAALLRDEEQVLEQLQILLDTEFASLERNDLAGIDERGTERMRATSRLLKIQDERRGMLALLNLPTGNEGLEELLRQCDPAQTLTPRWRRCADLATRCRDRNERNGMLVNARLRRIEGMLEVITAAPQRGTYGRDAALSSATAGRLLSAEA